MQVEGGFACQEDVPALTMCKVLDARTAGSGSLLTLACGSDEGVKRGDSGRIRGRSGSTLTVTAVFPSRSKASCQLAADQFRPGDVALVR